MDTLFDWSDIPEPHVSFCEHTNEDGTVDWRKRCLHLAHAADALQLACIAAPSNPHFRGPRDQMQVAGDLVYWHLEHLRADYQREYEADRLFDAAEIPEAIEIDRIKPALMRMLRGIRADNRLTTIVKALADAVHDSAAEIGEDASQESRDLLAVYRRWISDRGCSR